MLEGRAGSVPRPCFSRATPTGSGVFHGSAMSGAWAGRTLTPAVDAGAGDRAHPHAGHGRAVAAQDRGAVEHGKPGHGHQVVRSSGMDEPGSSSRSSSSWIASPDSGRPAASSGSPMVPGDSRTVPGAVGRSRNEDARGAWPRAPVRVGFGRPQKPALICSNSFTMRSRSAGSSGVWARSVPCTGSTKAAFRSSSGIFDIDTVSVVA